MLVIARLYAPEVYGSLSFMLSFVGIFDCLANLGLNNAHVKRVSEGKDFDDCVSTFALLKIVLTAVMVGAVLLSTLAFVTLTGRPLTAQALDLIVIFLVYQVMYDLVGIALLTFSAREQMAKAYLVNLLDPFIIILAIGGADVVQLALAYIVGSSLVLITGLALLRREKVHWKRPTLYRSYLAFAAPAAVVVIMEYIGNNADKILVGGAGTPEQVAYYSTAKYILTGLGAIGLAVYLNAFPAFSRKRAESKEAEIAPVSMLIERYISLLVTPLILVLILFPEPVTVFLFTTNYAPAAAVLSILSMVTLISILNQVHLARLMAMDRAKVTAVLLSIEMTCSVSLMILLMSTGWVGPPYIAAAVATLITAVLIMFLIRAAVHAVGGERPNWRMLVHLAVAMATILLLVVLAYFVPVTSIGLFLVFMCISYVAFEGIMYAIKELRWSDVQYMYEMAKIKGILSYIASEFRREKKDAP
jgi:O-antigen/teichoic acid export membrane protein